jgi:hypothetical protein
MNAYNQESWVEQDNQLREDELIRQRESGYTTSAVDPDDDELLDDDDDLDLDDDDLDADLDETDPLGDDIDTDDDLDLDDDDLEDDDDDLDDANRITGNGVGGRDFTASTDDTDPDPSERPEQQESDNEQLGYPSEQEFQQQDNGNDASFSEQTDVTPPRTHEFPDTGSPSTDFSTRDHGRTTGRMIGHEPGTEGI